MGVGSRLLRLSPLRAAYRRLRPARWECRAAFLSDVPGIATLIEPLFPYSARSEAQPSAERLLTETLRSGGEYRIALSGERIVAGCQIGPLLQSAGFREWWVLGVWVHPEFRSRGAGEALVRDAIDACRRTGEREVFCHIAASNRASLSLFRKLGFGDAPDDLRERINRKFGEAFGPAERIQVFRLDLSSTR